MSKDNVKHIVSFSGGKDSTALVLWAKENLKSFDTIFCDTGWEHPLTYLYIEYINKKVLDGKLIVLRPIGYESFYDLCIKKKRVPSAKARFCTEALKLLPTIEYIRQNSDQDYYCVLYQGIRADESKRRSQMAYANYDNNYGCVVVRPLLHWTADQTFEIMRTHGIEPNPLYKLGMSRVGCMPCIMVNHGEMKSIILQFPEVIDNLLQLESEVGRSFFPPNYIPGRYCSGKDKNGVSFPWVKDVVKYLQGATINQEEMFETPSCMSIYGLCE